MYGVAQIILPQERGVARVSHESAQRAVGRTPAHVDRRQRLRSPPEQCPRAPQHKQGHQGHHHMKPTPEREEQYGRLVF